MTSWPVELSSIAAAAPSSLLLVQPGETVSGSAVDASGFAWQILALDSKLLRDAADDFGLRRPYGPDFPQAIIQDPSLAATFARLHGALASGRESGSTDSLLEKEARLVAFLAEIVARCAAERPSARREAIGDPAVRRAREHLQDDYAASVTLEELTRISSAGSKFRLVRSFTREVGVPPHVFQTHLRLRQAKKLLAGGAEIADVALTVGFSDQSHLTRHFTPLVGVPPGQYRRAHAKD